MLQRLIPNCLALGSLLCAVGGVAATDYTFLPALPANNADAQPLVDITQCGSRFLAVGERGLVIYSDDEGSSWIQSVVPVSQTLNAVFCLAGGGAWAVGHGGTIIGSVDGGETWVRKFDGFKANRQWIDYTRLEKNRLEKAVAAASEDEVADLEYALEDAIFAVADAEEAVQTGPADPFLDVWFRDEKYGLAVGAYGMLYRTVNGGEDWLLAVDGIDNPDRYHYYSISENYAGVLFLSGEAGLMYRSLDDGESWEQLDVGYDGSLFGVVNSHDRGVLVFGLRGNIFRSVDGGTTWEAVEIENNPNLSLYGGARFADDSIALVGAAGAVLTSVNGGRVFQGRITGERNTLSSVYGSELSGAIAVGMDGVEKLYGAGQ